MKRPIVAYIICALISWYFISGIAYSEFRHDFHESESSRHHAGFAIAWGLVASTLWPIFLPGIYFTSGFAEYGIWENYPNSRTASNDDDP